MVFEIIEKLKEDGCIIKEQFHIYCPGCGGTRAVEALLHFDFLQSLYNNPAVILLLLLLGLLLIIRMIEYRKKDQGRYCRLKMMLCSGFLVVWLLFWAVRNCLLVFGKIDMLGDIL